jgi:hypothetical protein
VDCTIASNTAAYYGGVVGVREVRNCTVAYNRATYRWGGGVTMSYRGYGLISNCLVYGNSAYISYGAGICIVNQRADILDCIVSNNLNDCSPGVTLGYGAGIAFNLATGAIRNCTIVDNRVTKGSGFQYGGGLAKIGPGDLSVDRCTFARNAGPMGGGAFVTNTAFRNCLFLSNTGATEGAAMYLRANSTLVNCTVARNVSVPSGAVAAYAVGSGIGMVNCIVQSNTNQTSGLTANHANSAALPFTNSCAMPLPAFGAANIPDTPRFVDLSAGNCRLQSLSPCRDRGLFQAWMNGAPDLDGKRRIMGSDVDMGCYEFFVPRGTAFEIH